MFWLKNVLNLKKLNTAIQFQEAQVVPNKKLNRPTP